MNMEKLFWSIFNAENENELSDLVSANPILRDEKNWYPYGGVTYDDTSNFSTFENQQPEPIPALVEKITNSIDAILMKECRLNDIVPTSSDAPKSMKKAVEAFYGFKNGDLGHLTKKEKRNLAENIQIVASGDKISPNIMIYDNGEGQEPDNFPDTFLSLHKGNKINIHFTQGKYNMGSTGAVIFCGEERYQLIASKSNVDLDGNHEIGFTLVRRNPLHGYKDEDVRHSWYEYIRLGRTEIPRFSCKSLDLGLWNRKFISGSIVKLYSYQLPRGSRSDIERDLWRDLNQFLYDPALPILLYDKRFKNKTPSIVMSGNRSRIMDDDRDKIEKTIPISIRNDEIGVVSMEATVFKHEVKQTEYIKEKAVIYILNGQVHGFEPRRFISNNLGLPMLKSHLLLCIDCTQIRNIFRQELFMANRYNLKRGNKIERLIDLIITAIKENDILKELNQLRKERIIHEDRGDSNVLSNLINSIPLDREFINILSMGGALDFINKMKKNDQAKPKEQKKHPEPYVSKRYPSIFKPKLKTDSEGKLLKTIPLNGKGIIKLDTDAEDEYFVRPHDKGELKLTVLGPKDDCQPDGPSPEYPSKVEDIFDVTASGPTSNSIKISLSPNKNCSVGDVIQIKAQLSDTSGDIETVFFVKIIDPEKPSIKSEQNENVQPSLPKPVRVFEKKKNGNDSCWEDFGWSGDDIVRIIPFDDKPQAVEAIAINMDGFVLKRYLSSKRIKAEKALKYAADKYFINVYFHSLFLYSTFNTLSRDDSNFSEDIEELISNLFKSYSTFLVYMDINDSIISSLEID